MKKLFLIFVCAVIAIAGEYGSVVVDTINSVYDGDTFRCDINSYPPLIGDNISVRINGIDTPEIRGGSPCEKEDAIMVRDYVKQRFSKAKTIVLTNIQRPKYFRILADVYIDGENLSQELIRLGYAYPYDGGTKKSWECKKDY